MRMGILISAAAILVLSGGCAMCGHKECPVCNPPARNSEDLVKPAPAAAPIKVYAISATDLANQLEAALKTQGFAITSSENGVIQTDWKDYPGEFHIARRWQERSRFRVTVIPDISNPTGASRFEITEETQRRSNEKASWEPASRRQERANELAAQIAPRS